MKESVSYTYLLNMMLVFIVISFCVITALLSYTKAYRINSKIANVIEKSEGYNDLAKTDINRLITSFGYQRINVSCNSKEVVLSDGAMHTVSAESDTVGYCLYEIKDGNYYYYGITTYMMFDFPILRNFKIPVYNTTEKIYDVEGVL